MYHINLLKQCKEEVLIALMTAMSAEDDLGPKANSKCNSFHCVHNRILSHSPILLAKLQDKFIDVVSPLPSCIYLLQQQFIMNPGFVVHLRIASVQTKDSLHYPLLITPFCDASFPDLQGTDHLRQNPEAKRCMGRTSPCGSPVGIWH